MAAEEYSKKRRIEEEEPPAPGEERPVPIVKKPELHHDSLRKILSFLTEEQAIQLLLEASLKHPDVLHAVSEHVGRANSRKVFIRGLGFDVTSEDLKAEFQRFGELEEALVITEKGSSRSRGFGFVTFKDITSCLQCLSGSSITIKGRTSSYNLAAMGASATDAAAQTSSEILSSRKIYIGNVPVGCTAESILKTFSKFGAVEEGPIGLDKTTKQSRGYALILYETSEAARRAIEEPNKEIEGKAVYCKLATEGSSRQRVQPLQKGAHPPGHGVEGPQAYNFTQPSGMMRYQVAEGEGMAPGSSILGQPGHPQVIAAAPYQQYVTLAGPTQVNPGQPQPQYIIGGASMGQPQPFDPSAQVQYSAQSGPRPPAMNPLPVFNSPNPSQSYYSAAPTVSVAQNQQGSQQPGSYATQPAGQPGQQQVYDSQQMVIQPGQYFVGGSYGAQGAYQG